MMKRVFQVIMLVLLLLPASASAHRFKYNYRGVDFSCSVKDGKATIYAFNRIVYKVQIPAKVTDKTGRSWPVERLDLCLPDRSYKTTTIIIESGIKVIENYCFRNFKKLSKILIPNTIEYIGKDSFYKKGYIAFTLPKTIKVRDLMDGRPMNVFVVDEKLITVTSDDKHSYKLANNETISQTLDVENQVVQQLNNEMPSVVSDVDQEIPSTSVIRDNTFCLIIGNENYQQRDTPQVKYAVHDSNIFSEYCIRTLGIPSKHVKTISNATYVQFKDALRWFQNITKVMDDTNFIVYYAGHGIPDEKGHCRLLPTDVSINDAENAFSLTELYTSLGNLTTGNVLLLIDACFSGNDRNGDVALDDKHRGVMIEMIEDDIPNNVIVMTATSQKETALAYNEKGHGFFTYFLLKKLQESKGKVTYGELYEYIRREVSRNTVVIEEKIQTPSINTSSQMADFWKSMTF